MTSRIKGVVKSGLKEGWKDGSSYRNCNVVPWIHVLVNFSVLVCKDGYILQLYFLLPTNEHNDVSFVLDDRFLSKGAGCKVEGGIAVFKE